MSNVKARSRYGLVQVTSRDGTDQSDRTDVMLVYHEGSGQERENGADIDYHPLMAMSELEDLIMFMNRIYPEGWSLDTIRQKLINFEIRENNPGANKLAAEIAAQKVDEKDPSQLQKYNDAILRQQEKAKNGNTAPGALKVVDGPWEKVIKNKAHRNEVAVKDKVEDLDKGGNQ